MYSVIAIAAAAMLGGAAWIWLPHARWLVFGAWLQRAQFGDVFTGLSAIAAVFAMLVSLRQARAAKRAEEQAENQAATALEHAQAALTQARAAQRQAGAAEEQTGIQRQLMTRAAQPYVWADVRGDNATGTLLNLVVGNSGSSVARNVRVEIDPQLPFVSDMRERMESAMVELMAGLPSLHPGQVLQWTLGQAFNLIKPGEAQEHTFTIYADGPMGPLEPVTHIVKISALEAVLDRPDGTVHELTKAVKDVSRQISRLAQSGRTIETETRRLGAK